ncbi:MAG: thiamine phosphate synthase [Longimicrobiales bacterium]
MSTPLDLRVIVITDRKLAAPRTVEWVVHEALAAGAPAVQLRDKRASSAELLLQAAALLELTARHDARLFINDRLDVALASGAQGVHLGPEDLPIAAARRAAPALLLGFSTDSPEQAQLAQRSGADYIGCGAVFGTTSKAEAADQQIGPEGVQRVTRAVHLPVVAIGGITPDNVQQLTHTGAAGCAVLSAVMTAQRPGEVVQRLLRAFR